MRNINFYLIGLLTLFVVACSPELETINYDEINPAIFPASEADVEALVVSAYYPLRGSWSNGIHTTSENGIMFINDATTEILQGNFGGQQLATLHSYNPNNTDFMTFFIIGLVLIP